MRPLAFLGLALATAAAGALAAGCTTDAYCFQNCETGATATSTATGAGGDGLGGGFTTGTGIGGDCFPNCGTGSGGCAPTNGGIELCDGVDNDCNGQIDDGPDIDFANPKTCGTCDNSCYVSLLNCDISGIQCTPSADPGTVPGQCDCTKCAADYFDLDGDPLHTCEYYCVKTADDDVTCNNKDDDCDGVTDENVSLCTSITDCGKCGGNCVVVHGTPECQNDGQLPCDESNTHCAIAACDPGWVDLDNSYATGCEYQCAPSNGGVEKCGDGLDNDCDGKIDEADDLSQDPQIGVVCHGDPDGECATAPHAGVTICQANQVVCSGPNLLVENQVLETCNGLDDDCDGAIDDAPTDAGKSCGQSNFAPCVFGVLQCQTGALVCVGAVDPIAETCNGIDDDCDGAIDDAPMDAGGQCGQTDVGPCSFGALACQGGVLVCAGAVNPVAETCNGVDDDCNGAVDDGVPGAGASCGQSGTAPCALGAMQCQGGQMVCVGAVDPQQETCNQIDDDCDGVVDDNTTGSGVSCGQSGTFPCQLGSIQCVAGALTCVGAVNPQPEVCNGADDNCNGTIDDAPSGVGAACGQTDVGACQLGTTACQGGAITCVGAVNPQPETCNGVDDDCDGVVDDNPVGAGASCGASGTPPCSLGTFQCQGGALVCVGAVNPQPETCNGIDDNCNGQIDDNPSGVGASCGQSNTFPCSFGSVQCQAGALTCVGAVNPTTETCNGVDDNCDGQIDKTGVNPPADSVGPCNVPIPPPPGATSPCVAGAKACVAGAVVCQGSVGPSGPTDTCGVDANCDGALTNQPNLQTDVNNCGSCGNSCLAGAVHANWACVAGGCQFQGCQTGYYDLNNDQQCEYACTFISAQEACNGSDDDCDGQIDEGVSAPSPTQICGVSPSATAAECTSGVSVACQAGAWKCTFPAGVCSPTCAGATEVCDTLDNNCNGLLNENVANYGKPCASDDGLPPPGDGACRTTGTFVCNGPNAVVCSAVKASCASLPGGCTEQCDGIDNDCDGSVDETFTAKGTNAANFVKPVVTKIAAATWIYTYEASRPTATAASPGLGNGYRCTGAACAGVPPAPAGVTLDKTSACSVPTKIPWFNVTPVEVEQTCQAMGGTVCSTASWQTACQATAGCTWGYNPRGAACTSTYTASKYCNLGPSFDFSPGIAGDQDGLLVTGSAALQNCWGDWSGLQGNTATTNKLFDVTGNLREITKSAANVYPLMGGAFDSADPSGAACGFSFYSVDQSFQLFDLGFRCCFSSDPTL